VPYNSRVEVSPGEDAGQPVDEFHTPPGEPPPVTPPAKSIPEELSSADALVTSDTLFEKVSSTVAKSEPKPKPLVLGNSSVNNAQKSQLDAGNKKSGKGGKGVKGGKGKGGKGGKDGKAPPAQGKGGASKAFVMPPRNEDADKAAKKERKAVPMTFKAELQAKINQRNAAKGSRQGSSPPRQSKPPPPMAFHDELKAKMQSRRRAPAGAEEGSDDEW